jgi:8-oxo-dGTP pyrophosphatase MutT (NUDIX family)
MFMTPLKHVARIIVHHKQRTLLVSNRFTPHLLELPGGQKRSAERVKAAALRELIEETSVHAKAAALTKWGVGTLRTSHDSDTSVQWTVYVLQLDLKAARSVRPNNEIVACTWLTDSELTRHQYIERKSARILALYRAFSSPEQSPP